MDITNPNWDADVGILYENLATKKVARDFIGHSDRIKYRQAAPDNFIKNIRVTHDNDYIYFRVETDGDITPWESGKTNWMNLFIGIEGSKKPAFENYQFVVNRNPAGNNKTSLKHPRAVMTLRRFRILTIWCLLMLSVCGTKSSS